MTLSYLQPGLTLARGGSAPVDLVRSLQRDLRALGYKAAGIHGIFDAETERAIRALQIDLLKPSPLGDPGSGISRYNGAGGVRVSAVTGVLDQPLARSMAAMLAEIQYSEVPESDDHYNMDNARGRGPNPVHRSRRPLQNRRLLADSGASGDRPDRMAARG